VDSGCDGPLSTSFLQGSLSATNQAIGEHDENIGERDKKVIFLRYVGWNKVFLFTKFDSFDSNISLFIFLTHTSWDPNLIFHFIITHFH
jgi:hypothetical protein